MSRLAGLVSAVRVGVGLARVRWRGERRPVVVSWAVTNACNLRCVYCDTPSIQVDEATTEQALRLTLDLVGLAGDVGHDVVDHGETRHAGQARARGVDESELIAEIASQMPLGEIPEDGDVAEAVVFFCSGRSRMNTGQYLHVNGGQSMP